MKKLPSSVSITGFIIVIFISFSPALGAGSQDSIVIHSLGHASLYFEYKGLIIHVDPYSSQADYTALPDADIIFITHTHSDHYDLNALNKIRTDSTQLVGPQAVKDNGNYPGAIQVMKNGDSATVRGIPVKAVAAYNTSNNNHPRGVGNGYILTFGEKRIYIAGDTELIPEMDSLGTIDIAFIPMNLPYTMSVEMAAEAVKTIKPAIVYIYHFSSSDTASVRSLLKDEDVIVRIGGSVFKESDRQQPTNILDRRQGAITTPLRYRAAGRKAFLFDLAGRVMGKQRHGVMGEKAAGVRVMGQGGCLIREAGNW